MGSWAGLPPHTWPLPGTPLAADHPQRPAPSLSAPALPAGVCLVLGKVSGSQTLQGLGFRTCNDFMHFQYVHVSMTLILWEPKRFFIFSYLHVGIFGYCFLLETDVQHVLGAEIGPML